LKRKNFIFLFCLLLFPLIPFSVSNAATIVDTGQPLTDEGRIFGRWLKTGVPNPLLSQAFTAEPIGVGWEGASGLSLTLASGY
jgi:hypothetical protein